MDAKAPSYSGISCWCPETSRLCNIQCLDRVNILYPCLKCKFKKWRPRWGGATLAGEAISFELQTLEFAWRAVDRFWVSFDYCSSSWRRGWHVRSRSCSDWWSITCWAKLDAEYGEWCIQIWAVKVLQMFKLK